MPLLRRRLLLAGSALAAGVVSLAASTASAEVPVERTWFRLPSSNGHTAVLVDLSLGKMTHFRERLAGSEEPLLDAAGNEVWNGNQPQMVRTRDVLFDAFFGIRAEGDQRWLPGVPVEYDSSGYAGYTASATGGTGIVKMVQKVGSLTTTQYFFAPQGLPHAGFVMAMTVKNTGAATVKGVSAFSLQNYHLGTGRPDVMSDLGEDNETVIFEQLGGKSDFIERGFAGVTVTRALAPVARHGASNAGTPAASNVYSIVDAGGSASLPDFNGTGMTANGWVTAYQYDLGDLDPGESAWVGVAAAHHGDPFADAAVKGWLDAYVAGKNASVLVSEEVSGWKQFQDSLNTPAGLGAGDMTLLRHSAVMLKMGQIRDDKAYLREWLDKDGAPRYTRFGLMSGGGPATLPAEIVHRGKGAIIASLPPGEWTVAWIRDGSYAVAALSALGRKDEARDALAFYLNAEANRFQDWSELASYNMPPYQISLVRYYGFGVEETDFNDFGPNLEFDGFGLFLWALRSYEVLTGDTTLADQSWDTIKSKIADVLVALVDPANGLIRKDSSIWETHWNGRERWWAYTSITAARGLCDAAAIAERKGDTALAAKYRDAGRAVRESIAKSLLDGDGAIASNVEELQSGSGHFDAAVLDAIAMGLFHPKGKIAKATLKAMDDHLAVAAGPGWSRNDDRTDHAGGADLSGWGSEYDSAEWVITDMRGAVATYLGGDVERSDRLVHWVRDQSLANFLAVAETYEENTGHYKFNAPMVGFGSGAYALALFARDGVLTDPACGEYYDDAIETGGAGGGGAGGAGGSGGNGGSTGTTMSTSSAGSGGGGGDGGGGAGGGEGDCGCRVAGGASERDALAGVLAALSLGAVLRRRRQARRGVRS
ncbi:MAG: glycoside hydrolase family 15 protein [Polyangiaceae bacterium]